MPDKIIVRDWSQLQNHLQPLLNPQENAGGSAGVKPAISLVSFDIFDTLLARIETPEQVQRAVCRALAEELSGKLPEKLPGKLREELLGKLKGLLQH